MIISSIVTGVGNVIGKQVVDYMKTYRSKVQFEAMQGEILEGWVYKIRIAIRDAHQLEGVRLETHKKVMAAVEEVVREEFDSKKL